MKINIEKHLKKQNKSRYWLSKETGISDGLFTSLAKGRLSNITLKTAYKIAKALNVKIDDLIEED
ncbi:MAG: helix-turn-helix transcriptional regulator [Erysipelotrichaceae bacterium]|nr:helix-turn-helix transcriptional regulator [Erysipelotrichaceae bacterium]